MPVPTSRGWRLLATALSTIVVGGVAIWAIASGPNDNSSARGLGPAVPPEIASALASMFPDDRCVSLAAAKAEVRARLDQGGHADWVISADSSVPDYLCVAASIDAPRKTVVLLAALGPDLRAALETARRHLYSACLDRASAIAYLRGVLESFHDVAYDIRTDGPLTYPVDQRGEVQAHYDAGCWMYAVSGWSEAGHRIYYLVGR